MLHQEVQVLLHAFNLPTDVEHVVQVVPALPLVVAPSELVQPSEVLLKNLVQFVGRLFHVSNVRASLVIVNEWCYDLFAFVLCGMRDNGWL
jgi:hypothetical protein